jgi:hypothetical protein
LFVPLLGGCVTVAPRALKPAHDAPPAVASLAMAPPAAVPGAAPAPPVSAPDVGDPPQSAWLTPSASPPSPVAEESVPRLPPRRPGPQHAQPPKPPSPMPAPFEVAGPDFTLPADTCDGLARYGVFPAGGLTHRWCLARQQPH